MDKRKIVAALTDSKTCEDPNASALRKPTVRVERTQPAYSHGRLRL
jgi:hypothetical protein